MRLHAYLLVSAVGAALAAGGTPVTSFATGSSLQNCAVKSAAAQAVPTVAFTSVSLTVPAVQVGPDTVGPFTETVPGASTGNVTVGAAAGGCASVALGGLPLDSITGQVCSKLQAEVLDTGTGSTVWQSYAGGLVCAALPTAIGSDGVAVNAVSQGYTGLPTKGAAVPGAPSDQYTGNYRVLGSVDASVNGSSVVNCTQPDGSTHAACDVFTFPVF